MKLPFKLPSFKLPGFKLPSFGKKKAGKAAADDDDWENIDVDALDQAEQGSQSEAAEPAAADADEPAAPAGAGDADAAIPEEAREPSTLAELEDSRVDDSGDGDDDKKRGFRKLWGNKKRLIILSAGGVAGVLALAVLGWLVFSGDADVEHKSRENTGIPRFEMAIAPKDQKAVAGSLNAIVSGEKGPGAGIVAPASTIMAYAKITPPHETDGPLPTLQAPDLIEQSHQGALPRIAEDGRTSLMVYAKPFDGKDDRPKIALVVTGLGLSQAATEAAISLLPGAVTLAFSPYAPDLQGWADKARQAGHEILVMAPMEPETFPVDDPGPQGLMTTNSEIENLLRLEFILSRMQGYVGVISVMGSKFNQVESHLDGILKILKARGLLFVDGSADPKSLAPALAEKMKLPKAFADMVLDTTPTKEAIDVRLGELESVVRVNAVAVALIDAYPVSIERIAAWANGISERKLVLAPVSAVVDRQFLQ